MAGSPDDSTISDGFATQGNATSHAASSSSYVVASTAQDIKRRPGRPKGSKNKRKELFDPSIPKPRRGRPPGTGPKQKAAAAAALASTSDSDSDESAAPAKRPVGRPSKIPPAHPLQIRFREDGPIHVPGTLPLLRLRHLSQAADVIQSSNLGPIFDSTSPAQPPPPDALSGTTVPPNHLAPSRTEQRIIPETNSSAHITLPEEEDEYAGLLNDGLGNEDDLDDEPDTDGVVDDQDPTTVLAITVFCRAPSGFATSSINLLKSTAMNTTNTLLF
ncbi:hypothetical protein C8J57DRAFT_1658408 [Mycena rebaudengoi]|nr:hypothetical protein C8J57DRAFT_1658408 [Mycena rebaudengoi]